MNPLQTKEMESKIGQNDKENLDFIVNALKNKAAIISSQIRSAERVLTSLWDEKYDWDEDVDMYRAWEWTLAEWEKKIGVLYDQREAVNVEIEQIYAAKDEKQRRAPGAMAFTLTYSTNWGWSDSEAREHMRTALSRIQHYYKNELLAFYAVGEVGKNGLSHVHGMYHLVGNRRVTTKNWKRAYPKWNPKVRVGMGYQGGYERPIADITNYQPYIEEDLHTAWVVVDTTNGTTEEEINPSVVQEEAHDEETSDSSSASA